MQLDKIGLQVAAQKLEKEKAESEVAVAKWVFIHVWEYARVREGLRRLCLRWPSGCPWGEGVGRTTGLVRRAVQADPQIQSDPA